MQHNRHLRYTCLAVFQAGVWGIVVCFLFSLQMNKWTEIYCEYETIIHLNSKHWANKKHISENTPLAIHKMLLGMISVLNNSRTCEKYYISVLQEKHSLWKWKFNSLFTIVNPTSKSYFKSGPLGTDQIWIGKEIEICCTLQKYQGNWTKTKKWGWQGSEQR